MADDLIAEGRKIENECRGGGDGRVNDVLAVKKEKETEESEYLRR